MSSVYYKYSRHDSQKLELIFGNQSVYLLSFLVTLTAIIFIASPKASSQNAADLLINSETTILAEKHQQFISVEEAESETQPIDPTKETEVNKNYYIPPRIVPKERVHPLTTTLPLNSIPISHLTEWETIANYTFGENISTDLGFNGVVKLSSQVEESLSRDNIFQTEQIGSYLQLQTARKSRKIQTTFVEKQTLLGLELQMSLIGTCLFGEGNSTEECSYIPGLVIDRQSIDPDLLVPTRIWQTSNVGEVVTPESLAAIQQPGFQRGANGQEIGLDFYFPNIGNIVKEDQPKNNLFRQEEIDHTLVGVFSRVRQIVRANYTEAVIGRTVRGFPLIFDSDNAVFNSALLLSNLFLADAIPDLEGSDNAFNPDVNQNLFLSANNTRLPERSFTIYHAGLGKAESITSKVTNLQQVPAAHFQGVWLGLSPVVEYSSENSFRYQPYGQIYIIADTGGEGGADSDIQLISAINGEQFSTETLQNVHSQIYLQFFSQDVDALTINTLQEETNYYPHISFTGNITDSHKVFRYYTGAIFDREFKAYIGTDFNSNHSNGWSYSTGAIGYLNPDREYYSQLWGNVTKKISFSPQAKLAFLTGFNYAIDRPDRFREVVLSSRASTVTIGTRVEWGSVALGANYNFDNLLPNSLQERLLLDVRVSLSNSFRFSGYFTPINQNTSRSRYGATASWRLGNNYNSPTLILGWANNEYDFSNGFTQSDDIFTFLFRVGEPANPFDPNTAENLRNQEQQDVEQFQREKVRE